MPFQDLSKSLFAQIRSKPVVFIVIAVVALGALGSSLKYLDEDAQQQAALNPKDRSFLASVNPFLTAPSPTPTPQLYKEYIYAGSRLLAVEDAPQLLVTIQGRVVSERGRGLSGVTVKSTDENGATTSKNTNTFGFFTFTNVPGNHSYVLTAESTQYTFAPADLGLVTADITGIIMTPN